MTEIHSKPDTERPDRSTLRVLIAEKIVGAIYNDPHISVGPATQATRETGLRKADAILELVNRSAQGQTSDFIALRKVISDEWGSHLCYRHPDGVRSCSADGDLAYMAAHCRCGDIAGAVLGHLSTSSQKQPLAPAQQQKSSVTTEVEDRGPLAAGYNNAKSPPASPRSVPPQDAPAQQEQPGTYPSPDEMFEALHTIAADPKNFDAASFAQDVLFGNAPTADELRAARVAVPPHEREAHDPAEFCALYECKQEGCTRKDKDCLSKRPRCQTCSGDGYVGVHANLPDVKCSACGGTGHSQEAPAPHNSEPPEIVRTLNKKLEEAFDEIERLRLRELTASLRATAPHNSFPSRDTLVKVLCCPNGCVREDDCWSKTPLYQYGAEADAILKLFGVNHSQEVKAK